MFNEKNYQQFEEESEIESSNSRVEDSQKASVVAPLGKSPSELNQVITKRATTIESINKMGVNPVLFSNYIQMYKVPNQIQESDPTLGLNKANRFKRSKTSFLAENHQNKQRNHLIIVFLVFKFIHRLKLVSQSIRFKSLRKRIFSTIADKSSDFDFYFQNKLINYMPTRKEIFKLWVQNNSNFFKRFLQNIHRFIWTSENSISPGSTFLFIWEMVLLLLTIMNIFYIPIQVAFEIDDSQDFMIRMCFRQLPSFFFTVDILVSFFKAYYKKGILIMQKEHIFSHYLKGDFLVDVLVVSPFILEQFGVHYTNYLMIIRIYRVRRMINNIEEINNFQEQSAMLYELFCLISLVIFVSHFCACGWSMLARLEKHYYPEIHTWHDEYHITYSDWKTQYIYAIYWTAVTAMTTGYGDIIPQTNQERIFVTLVIFVVSGMFAYAVGQIGNIFNKLNEKREMHKNKIRIINYHIKKRGLEPKLQQKVKKYFEYFLNFKQEEEIDVEELMGHMHKDLSKEVMLSMYWKTLMLSDFIRENFSKRFLEDLCCCFKEKTYSPAQVLFKKGDRLPTLMFIMQGQVQTYGETLSGMNDTLLKTYHKNYVVGEKQFFLNKPMLFAAKAKNFVQVAHITQEDFLNLLKKYPEDHMMYCWKKDFLSFGLRQRIVTACEICDNMHLFEKCPYLFNYCNRDQILNRIQKNQDQNRIYKGRRRFKLKRQYPARAALYSIARFYPPNINPPRQLLRKNGLPNSVIEKLEQQDFELVTQEINQSVPTSEIIFKRNKQNQINDSVEKFGHKGRQRSISDPGKFNIEIEKKKDNIINYAQEVENLRKRYIDNEGNFKEFTYTDDRSKVNYNIDVINMNDKATYFPQMDADRVAEYFNENNLKFKRHKQIEQQLQLQVQNFMQRKLRQKSNLEILGRYLKHSHTQN